MQTQLSGGGRVEIFLIHTKKWRILAYIKTVKCEYKLTKSVMYYYTFIHFLQLFSMYLFAELQFKHPGNLDHKNQVPWCRGVKSTWGRPWCKQVAFTSTSEFHTKRSLDFEDHISSRSSPYDYYLY